AARPPERVRRSLRQWRGRRHARGVPRGGGGGAAALGDRYDDGNRMGQAALPGAAALRRGLRPGGMEERRPHFPHRELSGRLMRTDVNAFNGAYPWRRVPGTSPDAVLAAMDRVGIDEAWITHLPSLFWRDPTAGNPWLLE